MPSPKFDKPTPWGEFKIPLLKTLYEMDGSATRKAALGKMRVDLKESLKPADYQKVNENQEKWENNVSWARKALVKEGLLRDDSPYGLWELSQQGKDYVEKHFGPDGQD